MTHLPRRLVEVGACAAFFVSGACALCFERLWFEKAGLAFGNDVWASSTVLSAFMLGLAGGHALASRFPERFRSLRTFAVLELVAAVSGAGLVVFFAVVESHFAGVTANVSERPWLIGAWRLLAAAPMDARDSTPLRVHELARALVARDPKTALLVVRKMSDAELPLPGLRSYVQNAAIHAHDGDVVLP